MTKYEKISVLAKETARSIGENKESWMNYLDLRTRFSYMHSVRMPPPVPHWKCGMRKCFAG